jgi:uncharacterized protein
MLEVIEKLLILQDRDRKIHAIKDELARIEPERQMITSKAASAQSNLEGAKLRLKQIESDRKKLELDVEAKKQQIEKYALQQFETKKNEEYRALGSQIETCKADIIAFEDKEIELMEQAEAAQKQNVVAIRESDEVRKAADAQLKDLAQSEQALKTELASLESNRAQLTVGIDKSVLARYERLLKQKGDHVVVGIQHGVCGGCHMKFPVQVLVSCQGGTEIVPCPNCGRILYYTHDMDLTVMD